MSPYVYQKASWLVPASPCRLCCRAAVFARRHMSMPACQPLLEWYSPAAGLPLSCADRVVMPPWLHDSIKRLLACEPSP